MSNLQDVPLAEPEVLEGADSEEAQMHKTNSLKRFFKISKKPAVKEFASEVSLDAANKELRKTNTLSRIFSRKKLPKEARDVPEQSSSTGTPIPPDRPSTTPKPVKSSMSMYWKRLFHLHKTQNPDGGSGPEQSAVNGPEEVHELKLVQTDSEVQTDLDEPDFEPMKQPQPETAQQPKAKQIDTGKKTQRTVQSGLAAEPKESKESVKPASSVANQQ